MNLIYLQYRIKTFFGVKFSGHSQHKLLVINKLLKKYNLPIYSMNVARVSEDLNTADLNEIHQRGIRLANDSYISIIINPNLRQVFLVVGDKINNLINKSRQEQIEKIMQNKMIENEVLRALEIGMKEIYLAIKQKK